MQLREVQVRDDEPWSLRLHPRVTVVAAAGIGRALVVTTLRDVLQGRLDGVTGTMTSHGVELELLPELAGLLGLDDHLDPVVRATDLPVLDARGAAALHEARVAVERAERELAGVRRRLRRAGGRAAGARRAAPAGPSAPAGPAAAAARAEAEQVMRRRFADHLDLTARLDEPAVRRPQVDAALLVRIDRELADARAELEAARVAARRRLLERRRAAQAAAAVRREHLLARREAAAQELETLVLGDVLAVEDALARTRAVGDDLAEAEACAAVLDAWLAADARLREASARLTDHHQAVRRAQEWVVAAEQRLEAAHLAQVSAATAFAPEAARREIEVAHAAVLDAESKVNKRLSGPAARRRLEEAITEERSVLARYGFLSWMEYLMSGSVRSVDEHLSRQVDLAEAELQAARTAMAGLGEPPTEAVAEADRARAAVLQRASEVLGHPTPPERVEALLRARLSPLDPHVALRQALAAVGVRAGDDAVADATAWLAEQERRHARAVVLRGELAAIDAQLAAADQPVPGAAAPPAGPGPDPDLEAEVEVDGEVAAARAKIAHLNHERQRLGAPAPLTDDDRLAARERSEARAELVGQVLDSSLVLARSIVDWLDQTTGAAGDGTDGTGTHEAGSDATGIDDEPAAALLEAARTLADARTRYVDAVSRLDSADPARARRVRDALIARVDDHAVALPTGALPVVLDDALRVLPADERVSVLGEVARHAGGVGAVQLVVVTDDEVVLRWAAGLGDEQGALCRPAGLVAAAGPV